MREKAARNKDFASGGITQSVIVVQSEWSPLLQLYAAAAFQFYSSSVFIDRFVSPRCSDPKFARTLHNMPISIL